VLFGRSSQLSRILIGIWRFGTISDALTWHSASSCGARTGLDLQNRIGNASQFGWVWLSGQIMALIAGSVVRFKTRPAVKLQPTPQSAPSHA
jgi:hypothetical protein